MDGLSNYNYTEQPYNYARKYIQRYTCMHTHAHTHTRTHTHTHTHVPNIPFTSDVPTLVGGGGWYLVYSKTRQIFVFNGTLRNFCAHHYSITRFLEVSIALVTCNYGNMSMSVDEQSSTHPHTHTHTHTHTTHTHTGC